jgi:predicted permease
MLHSVLLRIRALLKRRQLERDLRDELAYHLEMRQGRERAPFGNATLIREQLRDAWSFVWLENLWRDVRHAARVLRRAPGHTAAVILLLAIGIGANAAMFSVFNAVFLRPLAVDHPEELAILSQTVKDAPGVWQNAWSVPRLEEFRGRQTSFSGIFAMGQIGSLPSLDPSGTEVLGNQQPYMVSGNFFQVLGVRAAMGRGFTPADDQPQNPNLVLVASDTFWRRYLGGDPAAVGRTVYFNRRPFTVIGVTPRGFVGLGESLWVPMNALSAVEPGLRDLPHNARTPWTRAVGRLKPGVSFAQAQSEADVLYAQMLAEPNAPEPHGRTGVRIDPGSRGFRQAEMQYGKPLQVLMGIVVLLLLIACANVGSLLLARAGSRQREIAVRLALGCGRRRLIRQFLIESLLLAAGAGAIGLAVASAGVRGLAAAVIPADVLAIDVSVDTRVLLFTVAASCLAAVLFGIVPALRASRVAIEPALKSAAQTTTGSRSRHLLNRSFTAAQVALSVVAVAGSALFAGSLYRLYRSAGFDAGNVLAVNLNSGGIGYDLGQYSDLVRRLQERLSIVPGVKSVSVASSGIMSGMTSGSFVVDVPGAAGSPGRPARVETVSTNFLETLGIPVVAGRGLLADDHQGAPLVAVVNETFARAYFRGESALGKVFSSRPAGSGATPTEVRIVGVVRDIKDHDLRDSPLPMAYVTFEQFPMLFFDVLVKIDHPGEAMLPLVRSALLDVNPKLRPYRMEALDDAVGRSISRDILLARLTGLFGVLALGLACFGVYGVVSYLVVSRTTEIGIRLAVGARPGNVLRHVIGDALKTVAPGVAVGIAVAMAGERFVASLLFAFKPRDPLTYGAVAACLLLTAALAAYLPARRASRIDPVQALRCE